MLDDTGPSRHELVTLGVVALAARLAYLLTVAATPLRSDAAHYHEIGANLARGAGFVHQFPQLEPHATAFRPPLYPALLGLVYRVTGASPGVGRLVNVAIGVAVVVLAATLAGRLAGRRAGLVAGGLLAAFPPLVANDTVTLSEPLSLLLLLAGLHLLVARRPVAAGIAAGLLVLTRPDAPLLVAALAGWLLIRVGWRPVLRFAIPVLALTAPWLVRNVVQVDTVTLTTSTGFNLAAIYSPEAQADGSFVDPVFDPRFEEFRLAQFDEGQWERDLRAYGLANLRRDPAQVVDVAAGNVRHWFELAPRENEGAEALDGRNLVVRELFLPLVWLTTAVGLVGLWRHRRENDAQLLLVVALAAPITPLLFLAPPRLRSAFDLVCVIGVGLAAAALAPAPRPVRLGVRLLPALRIAARVALPVGAVLLLATPIVWGVVGGETGVDGVDTDAVSATPTTPPPPPAAATRPASPTELTIPIAIRNPTDRPFVTSYVRVGDEILFASLPATEAGVTATWRLVPEGTTIEGLDVLNTLTLDGETAGEVRVGVSFHDGQHLSTANVYELRFPLVTDAGGLDPALGPPEGFAQINLGNGPEWWPIDLTAVVDVLDEAETAVSEGPRAAP